MCEQVYALSARRSSRANFTVKLSNSPARSFHLISSACNYPVSIIRADRRNYSIEHGITHNLLLFLSARYIYILNKHMTQEQFPKIFWGHASYKRINDPAHSLTRSNNGSFLTPRARWSGSSILIAARICDVS